MRGDEKWKNNNWFIPRNEQFLDIIVKIDFSFTEQLKMEWTITYIKPRLIYRKIEADDSPRRLRIPRRSYFLRPHSPCQLPTASRWNFTIGRYKGDIKGGRGRPAYCAWQLDNRRALYRSNVSRGKRGGEKNIIATGNHPEPLPRNKAGARLYMRRHNSIFLCLTSLYGSLKGLKECMAPKIIFLRKCISIRLWR